MERHGIAYLAEDPEEDPPFVGYWDNGDPPAMLEEGPGWMTAAEAVAWGRKCAQVVLIRLWPARYFSAGDMPEESLPAWPDEPG